MDALSLSLLEITQMGEDHTVHANTRRQCAQRKICHISIAPLAPPTYHPTLNHQTDYSIEKKMDRIEKYILLWSKK